MVSGLTAPRQRLVTALYDSAAPDGPGAPAFRSWLAVTGPVRGPWQRKRRVADARLARMATGIDGELDLARFMFAVEATLAVRAALVTHLAAAELSGRAAAGAYDELDRALTRPAVRAPESGVAWVASCVAGLPAGAVQDEVGSARLRARRALAGPLHDVFQDDHRTLIPKELRHATGAHYTPPWLARHVLHAVGYRAGVDGFAGLRLADPACGSGSFLMAAAEELRRAMAAGSLTAEAAVCAASDRLCGVDLDPLAAAQAAANLTLAVLALGGPAALDLLPLSPQVACRDSLLDRPGALRVDAVVGNPPWVNWEYLPPEYRSWHADLWSGLGMFDLRGRDKAFSKEDISALFLVAALGNYLGPGGKLAFLVPQSLVKSALNHRGLRRLTCPQAAPGGLAIEVDRVEDFVAVRPFDGVANRAILLSVSRAASGTRYPVRYRRWLRVDRDGDVGAIADATAGDAMAGDAVDEVAEPADPDDPGSHWTTGPRPALAALRRVAGRSAYRARTGVFTGGANGVFHLELTGTRAGLVQVRNVTARAKRLVPCVEAELEPTFVYPHLRGREVGQWSSAGTSLIVLPHTAQSRMWPVPEETLAAQAPATLDYLRRFRVELGQRKGFAGWENRVRAAAFYACQRVGDYTFAPWKVVWRYIATRFTCAVVGPYQQPGPFAGRPVVPNEKLMVIPCGSATEAYFVCGVLSSSPAAMFVESRMIATQIAPHLIERLAIPPFQRDDPVHLALAAACRCGHEAVAAGRSVCSAQHEVDAYAADVLGASRTEARMLRQLLAARRHR